jgi:hypothetical protein
MSTTTTHRLPLTKAGRLFPSRPDRRTLWRWIRHGIETSDGRLVRLGATVIVGRYYVTPEDAEEFIKRQQPRAGRPNR